MLTGLTQLEHLPDGLGLLGQSRASSAEDDLGQNDAAQGMNETIVEDTIFPRLHQSNHSYHYPPTTRGQPGDRADSEPTVSNDERRKSGDILCAAVEQIVMLPNLLSIGNI